MTQINHDSQLNKQFVYIVLQTNNVHLQLLVIGKNLNKKNQADLNEKILLISSFKMDQVFSQANE